MQSTSSNNGSNHRGVTNSPYRSWAERNGFADWTLALFWIIGAFILFQVTANLVALVLISMEHGLTADPNELMGLITGNLDLVFIGNSTGQILFLGLATWFYSRLHTSKKERPSFLRFKLQGDTGRKVLITIVLILIIQPTIWFLSWLNAFLPVPEVFSEFQSSQMQLIENFLRGDNFLLFTLFHVAVVPAICEEVLYRGYVLKAFQKSWSIWPAILVSGLLFGLYHLQLSNLLPLASLGILFGYITWAAESIYPAMVAHFINNGGSVLVGIYYPESAFAEITPESLPPMWAVIPSLILSAYILYWMYNHRTKQPA